MIAKRPSTLRFTAKARRGAVIILFLVTVQAQHAWGQNITFTNTATSLAETNGEETLPPSQTNTVAPNPYPGLTFGLLPNQAVLPGPTTGTGLLPSPITGRSILSGPPPAGEAAPPGSGIAQIGPVDIHAHVNYNVIYGNGIESTPGQPNSTVVNTVSPGVTFQIGSHWTLTYTPTLYFYSSPAYQDTTDHTAVLQWATTYENWTFALVQSYAKSFDSLVETGMQTAQENYDTSLNADVQLGSHWSSQSSVSQVFRFAPDFNDLHQWSGSETLNYEIAPSLSLGVTLSGGYDAVSTGSDMPFEDIEGRLNFRPGPKLAISLSCGAEDRQFVNPSAKPLISPIFDASILYQLFPKTSLSLSAARSVSPSFFGDQIITLTTVSVSLQHQLSAHWSFQASGGYSDEPFTSITPMPLPAFWIGAPPRVILQEVRDDTTTYINASLSVALGKRVFGSVFYSVTANSSGQKNYDYTSHQVGLSLSWQY